MYANCKWFAIASNCKQAAWLRVIHREWMTERREREREKTSTPSKQIIKYSGIYNQHKQTVTFVFAFHERWMHDCSINWVDFGCVLFSCFFSFSTQNGREIVQFSIKWTKLQRTIKLNVCKCKPTNLLRLVKCGNSLHFICAFGNKESTAKISSKYILLLR